MRVLLAGLLALAAVPAAGDAQVRDSGARVRSYVAAPGPQRIIEWFVSRKGRIGVTIDTRAADTDSIGALVAAVTPGGPAARAGIRSGDIITALNGSVLARVRRGPPGASSPGVQLIELAARVEPGDTVSIAYRRGSARRTAQLVADESPEFAYGYSVSADSNVLRPSVDVRERVPLPFMREEPAPAPGGALSFYRFGISDLELAPMNPGLGRYFGVRDGVLVIQVPEDSRLELEPGDVVLSLDGREPTSPGHMLRILRSYQPGEPIRLEIMRQQKRRTIMARP
jgi:S1-C subfamily serine protease